MALLIFLVIIPLLDDMRSYLKKQWFILWCETSSALSSRPKRFSVDHRFSMSSPMRLSTTVYLFTSSKIVGIWDGLPVGVSRSSPVSRRCLPRKPPWCAPLGWKIWVDMPPSSISRYLLKIGAPCNPPLWSRKVLIGHQNRVMRSVLWNFFAWSSRFRGGLYRRRVDRIFTWVVLLVVGVLRVN